MFIIFGFVVGCIASIFVNFCTGSMLAGGVTILGSALLGFCLSVLPLEGYHDTQEKTIKLIKLRRNNSEGKTYYVEKLGTKLVKFAFDNSEEYGLDGIAYEEVELYGKIKIYESDRCNSPIMKEFITTPIRNEVTFSNLFTKKEYVFYLPEGTVLEVEQ